MTELPRVFIASSSEGLHVAEAVNIRLEHDAKIKQWDNAFDLSSMTLPSLVSRAQDTDFALFVFHKDDKTIIRGTTYSVVRDNVLFELGLFIGAVGVERCFVLIPKSSEGDFRMPTDLAGLTVAVYDDSLDDMVDAVTTSCAKIKQAIRRLHKSDAPVTPPANASAATQEQLRSVQSELWSTRIDMQRAVEQQAKLMAAVTNHFYAVAKPATETEIAKWEEGAKESYATPPKIRGRNIFFVDKDVIIPPLHGASSISVIVAPGVRVQGFDQWSHNAVYLMDGYRKLG